MVRASEDGFPFTMSPISPAMSKGPELWYEVPGIIACSFAHQLIILRSALHSSEGDIPSLLAQGLYSVGWSSILLAAIECSHFPNILCAEG
jgi:hypothetical protein